MYDLIVRDREAGWQDEVFHHFAAYLRSEGMDVHIKVRQFFNIQHPPGCWQRTPMHPAMAILQNNHTRAFWVLDLHDWSEPFDIAMEKIAGDPNCQIYLKGQYEEGIYNKAIQEKITPWTYFEAYPTYIQSRIDAYRPRRRAVDRLYFRGTICIEERGIILARLQKYGLINNQTHSVDLERYLHEVSNHTIMLALPGMGKLCHREIEAFGLGTPVLMPRHKIRLHNDLTPDFHYISVPVDSDEAEPELIADRIAERYQEIRHDRDFQAHVAENAKRWYDANVRFPNSLALTAKLLRIRTRKSSIHAFRDSIHLQIVRLFSFGKRFPNS